ncbi:ATP synthase F1 subunit epsilon [Candidatus Saccharibacteria bacterium]|nr:MAG: ATP synthase F1 subunit epsilon [Candidatus Saccharibacteria bacterium]
MRFQLVSLDGLQFDEDVYEVTIPTMAGYIGVLPGHMPLISVAKTGIVSVRRTAGERDDMREQFAISGGAVEVSGNTLRVLVDEADNSEEINEEEAKAAHDRALKLKADAKDQLSLEHAQALLDRTAVRLQVAGLKRRKR